MAEIDKSGQVVNAPRPFCTMLTAYCLTATQIDDKIALAYSKGIKLDESEVFFSVVNASDLSVVIPNKKLPTVK